MSQQQAESGDHDYLDERSRNDRSADCPQVAQREMQADIEQEKNHAEFGELLDRGEITAEARREGADSDTGQHISHHGWQLQAASKKPTHKGSQESHSKIDQDRKFMLHLLPPFLT